MARFHVSPSKVDGVLFAETESKHSTNVHRNSRTEFRPSDVDRLWRKTKIAPLPQPTDRSHDAGRCARLGRLSTTAQYAKIVNFKVPLLCFYRKKGPESGDRMTDSVCSSTESSVLLHWPVQSSTSPNHPFANCKNSKRAVVLGPGHGRN